MLPAPPQGPSGPRVNSAARRLLLLEPGRGAQQAVCVVKQPAGDLQRIRQDLPCWFAVLVC